MTRLTLFIYFTLSQSLVHSAQPIQFTDVTAQSGIVFKHHLGRSGKGYILETVASGCAFVDYDNDEDLDIYLVNGASLPGSPLKDAKIALCKRKQEISSMYPRRRFTIFIQKVINRLCAWGLRYRVMGISMRNR